jgi:hypothetical protein
LRQLHLAAPLQDVAMPRMLLTPHVTGLAEAYPGPSDGQPIKLDFPLVHF